jgi:hypothetical protein
MNFSMETMMSETKNVRKIGDIDPVSFAGAVAQAAAVRFQQAKLDDDPALEDPVVRLALNGWMTSNPHDDLERLEVDGDWLAATLDTMANYVCDRIERGADINGETLFNKCAELDLIAPGSNIRFGWADASLSMKSLFNLYASICGMSFLALEAEQRAEAAMDRDAARANAAATKVPADQLIFEREGSSLEKDPDMAVKEPARGKAAAGGKAAAKAVQPMSAGETVTKRPVKKGGRPRKAAVPKTGAKTTTDAAQKS